MHHFQRAFYEVKFLAEFLRKNGVEFQNFFSEIMEKVYPGDFQRIRPWGNIGDRKCDGYLRSERRLFQVYAPNDIRLKNTLAKIDEDFHGALPYWRGYFDKWVFVHNSYHGIAADIETRLDDLEAANTPLKIERCGFEELRREVFRLDITDISSLLGLAPTTRDMMQIGLEDLRPVLTRIAGQKPDINQSVKPVPSDKIEANGLSDAVEELIRFGMHRASLVQKFFDKYYDPRFGESIAEAFKQEYQRLRATGLIGDEIFSELQVFAGGERVPNAAQQCSVLAVLAYLFERCHIFEPSRFTNTL